MATLIITLGKLGSYDSKTRYRHGSQDLGEFVIPASAVAVAFKPTRILCHVTDIAAESFSFFAEELREAGLPAPERIDINVPNDEQGVSELLNTILQNVPAGEELHLDFTFGLRSLTILNLLATDYLRQLGRARIGRLTYVNFEASKVEGSTEILDLTTYLHLPVLAKAASRLESHGDLTGLADAVSECYPSALSREDLKEIREISNRLLLLRAQQIGSPSGRKLFKKIITLFQEKAKQEPALKPVADKVHAALYPLLESSDEGKLQPRAIASLARWYLNHQQPALALLITVEGAVAMAAIHVLNRGALPESFEKAVEILESAESNCGGRGLSREAKLFRELNSKHSGFGARKQRNTLAHAQMDGNSNPQQLSRSEVEESVACLEELATLLEGSKALE